jgi:hypothetical protein
VHDLRLSQTPIAKTGMLIRRPVAEVFEAIVNPDITATDSTQGFSLMLAGLKALLEHDVRLNLVGDRYPRGLEEH